MSVMVWIDPGAAWWSAVDAMARVPDPDVVLLLVTPLDAESLAVPGEEPASLEDQAATLFDEAEARLGRPARRLWERGHCEREVVAAADGMDLLVVVREISGELGPQVRHVLDHAPCSVLLVRP